MYLVPEYISLKSTLWVYKFQKKMRVNCNEELSLQANEQNYVGVLNCMENLEKSTHL